MPISWHEHIRPARKPKNEDEMLGFHWNGIDARVTVRIDVDGSNFVSIDVLVDDLVATTRKLAALKEIEDGT